MVKKKPGLRGLGRLRAPGFLWTETIGVAPTQREPPMLLKVPHLPISFRAYDVLPPRAACKLLKYMEEWNLSRRRILLFDESDRKPANCSRRRRRISYPYVRGRYAGRCRFLGVRGSGQRRSADNVGAT